MSTSILSFKHLCLKLCCGLQLRGLMWEEDIQSNSQGPWLAEGFKLGVRPGYQPWLSHASRLSEQGNETSLFPGVTPDPPPGGYCEDSMRSQGFNRCWFNRGRTSDSVFMRKETEGIGERRWRMKVMSCVWHQNQRDFGGSGIRRLGVN